jgi:hypothetical protein
MALRAGLVSAEIPPVQNPLGAGTIPIPTASVCPLRPKCRPFAHDGNEIQPGKMQSRNQEFVTRMARIFTDLIRVNSPAATGASTAGEIRVHLFLDKLLRRAQSKKMKQDRLHNGASINC